MKKTLQFLMVVLFTASLTAQTFDDGTFTYNVIDTDNNYCEVTGWVNLPTENVDVVIPGTAMNGFAPFTVTKIGLGAFSCNTAANRGAGHTENTFIQTVTLPQSVTIFDAHVFRDNPNLTSINLDNVVDLGSNAFVACTGLTGEISLPVCTNLGAYPFFNCNNIESISAPVAETGGAGVFYGMDGVKEYNVPASLMSIGNLFLGDDDTSNALEQVQLNWDATQLAAVNFANDSKFFRNEWADSGNGEPGTGTKAYGDMTVADLTGWFAGTPVKIYVPVGSKQAYLDHISWCRFPEANIIEGTAPVLSTKTVEAKALGFNVYPNPATNIVSIKNAKALNAEVEVLDLNGRILLNKNATNNLTEINISNLKTGMYLFKIKTQDNEFVKRVVKQ
ncbi:hypothetical protein PW52_16835, partial [Tamlana sedimentorum]